jgi:DNA repair and recombination protein RAD52
MPDMQVVQYQPTVSFTPEQEEQLKQPLNTAHVATRKGFGGQQLSYIKVKTAIETANDIFGVGRWGYKVLARSREQCADDKKGTIEFYTCDIELSVVGSAFPFPGDGVGIVTAPYTVEMHEKARKEAASDALKRALRHYGSQFGLSLYSEDDELITPDGQITTVKDNRNGKAPASTSKPNNTVNAAPASSLDKLKTDAVKCGFVTGKNAAELRASFNKQIEQVFGGSLSDDDLALPQNMTKLSEAIEAFKRLQPAK